MEKGFFAVRIDCNYTWHNIVSLPEMLEHGILKKFMDVRWFGSIGSTSICLMENLYCSHEFWRIRYPGVVYRFTQMTIINRFKNDIACAQHYFTMLIEYNIYIIELVQLARLQCPSSYRSHLVQIITSPKRGTVIYRIEFCFWIRSSRLLAYPNNYQTKNQITSNTINIVKTFTKSFE